MFNVVLFEPQIPQNTGNIARTCFVSSSRLHLIKPYGFSISDRYLKRAGLDYWRELELYEYKDFDEFYKKNDCGRLFLITTKAKRNYAEFRFEDEDYFVFGSETAGLPKDIHERFKDTELRIPMAKSDLARCLNLSNSVAVILYEALRQNDFLDLS